MINSPCELITTIASVFAYHMLKVEFGKLLVIT
jgi:hypothetical protein